MTDLTKNHQNFLKIKVFLGLDGLRFLSILMVVWHHTVSQIHPYFKASSYGFLGVDLFFVISGFLIVTLLLRERDLTGTISLKKFYIRRSLRIFPLYYGFILALAVAYFIFNKNSEFGRQYLQELPIYLFFLGNFFVVQFSIVWSLASEEQFYLLWPFIEKYLSKYIVFIVIIALAINQSINFYRASIAEWLHLPQLADLEVMQTTFTPILLGVVLAHTLNNKSYFNFFHKILVLRYAVLLALLTLALLCQFLPADISGWPRLLLQLNMLLLLTCVVLNPNNVLMPLMNLRLISRIGAVSYGIYIFHIHVITLVRKLLELVGIPNEIVLFVIAFILSALVAEISYRYFESWFLKYKTRYSVVHQQHV